MRGGGTEKNDVGGIKDVAFGKTASCAKDGPCSNSGCMCIKYGMCTEKCMCIDGDCKSAGDEIFSDNCK